MKEAAIAATWLSRSKANSLKGEYTVGTTEKMAEMTGTMGKIFAALVFCSQHLK
ncbi:hypothetical protein HFO60_01130 [Rhizobium leguminosarum]|uniref:hypothetical protein n=1 Tax=Rhizobium leguminosarum TaxID=384 RepID=UPI001C9572E9|nr:hypothetical protein [Rhizobium leguminosarum]MBY5538685.1 hypothetical protein [Rhizobium leguminosarum]